MHDYMFDFKCLMQRFEAYVRELPLSTMTRARRGGGTNFFFSLPRILMLIAYDNTAWPT